MNPLADRITAVHHDLFRDAGLSALVASLDLSLRTWMNYEAGVAMPASVMLRFIVLAAVEPLWLLRRRPQVQEPPRVETPLSAHHPALGHRHSLYRAAGHACPTLRTCICIDTRRVMSRCSELSEVRPPSAGHPGIPLEH